RSAFDEVARKREWGAGETDKGYFELLLQLADGFHHETKSLVRIKTVQRVEVFSTPDWPLNDRANVLADLERRPHRSEGNGEVRKEDRGVEPKASDWLQRR